MMKLSVLSPDREIFSGEIQRVKVPGIMGQFEILNDHAAIISALGEGQIKVVKADGSTLTISIQQGFVEVLNNEVSLLVHGVNE